MMCVTFVEYQIETKTRGERVPANSTHTNIQVPNNCTATEKPHPILKKG